ncbi:MAG: hypothetical protein DRP51_03820 [Candidatus Zixiibacteriota bacterium]|nr:MAG: hypothetical protein DRP51_03820 [candidate division Zixibacteria bacterium]HHI01943.1 hypothetical protein [candidate division Zixibacteria bacterium]
MKKRVTLYSNPDDPTCQRVEEFLSEQDIILNVHDVKTRPLDFNQISKLLRNFDLKHFYNSNGHSKGRKKNKAESEPLDRQTIIGQLAADNTLLRLPIVLSGRLLTVGDNVDRIGVMLQIRPIGVRELTDG